MIQPALLLMVIIRINILLALHCKSADIALLILWVSTEKIAEMDDL